MDEDRQNINISSSGTMPSNNGTISMLPHNEKVWIKRPSCHNEISILEENWIQIKRKVSLIKIERHIDFLGIVIGAMIPYLVDIIVDLANKEAPDYLPLILCIVVYIFIKRLSNQFNLNGDSTDQSNSLHLKDLQELISIVDSSSYENGKHD